jgi:hypothetical protein
MILNRYKHVELVLDNVTKMISSDRVTIVKWFFCNKYKYLFKFMEKPKKELQVHLKFLTMLQGKFITIRIQTCVK